MYFRTNITQELIGKLLFVDQSAIFRAISDLEEIIAAALDKFVPELPEEIDGRVGVVDGSLFRCWSWADALELYSGKHKTTGHAHRFVWDLSVDLMYISDSLPDDTQDAKAMHETSLSEIFGDDNSVGDKGYVGTGITPFRKPAGGDPLDGQKWFSTAINKIHYVIERAIVHLKSWRCMHVDYRRPKRTYGTAFKRRPSTPFLQATFHIILTRSNAIGRLTAAPTNAVNEALFDGRYVLSMPQASSHVCELLGR